MVFVTSGQIAQEMNEDRDRVAYALRKTGTEPIGRAGIVRLFAPSAVDIVRKFLAGTGQRRGAGREFK